MRFGTPRIDDPDDARSGIEPLADFCEHLARAIVVSSKELGLLRVVGEPEMAAMKEFRLEE